MLTVIAQMVSVEIDSVRVLRMGETPERNKTNRTDGFTDSVSTSVVKRKIVHTISFEHH